MLIMINYGNDKLTLEMPDHISVDEYKHMSTGSSIDIKTFKEILTSAEERLFAINNVDLFVLNDAFRRTPSHLILEWTDRLGKLNNKAKFLIATGCHQSPDEAQLKTIFGNSYSHLKNRILVHDAGDTTNLVEIGQDSFQQPVLINKHFYNAERVVIIGSVEPHYFAGFTGGRKSIFPGLCDYKTTVRNHNLAVSFKASPMKLNANPVEEHLQLLMKLIPIKKIFGIQIVLSETGDVEDIFCGDIHESFNNASELSSRLFGIKFMDKYDFLLAEVRPPLDGNLYQLQKSLENCQLAVKDDGTIILFSPCRDGIGTDNFYRLVESWHPENDTSVPDEDNFGIHKLRRVYEIGRRINIRLFSELPGDVPEKVFFNSEDKPQLVFDNLIKENEQLKVCLVRDAGYTVLIN